MSLILKDESQLPSLMPGVSIQSFNDLIEQGKKTGNYTLCTDAGLCLAMLSWNPEIISRYLLKEMGIRVLIGIDADGLLFSFQEHHSFCAVMRALRGSFMVAGAMGLDGKKAIKIFKSQGDSDADSAKRVFSPRIYISSKRRHAAKWRDLRTQGINITSTWIDECEPGKTTDESALASRAIQEILCCDFLVLYCERNELLTDSLIAAGAALGSDKPVRCVGDCASLSPLFKLHPLWLEYKDISVAMTAN